MADRQEIKTTSVEMRQWRITGSDGLQVATIAGWREDRIDVLVPQQMNGDLAGKVAAALSAAVNWITTQDEVA